MKEVHKQLAGWLVPRLTAKGLRLLSWGYQPRRVVHLWNS